MQLPPKEKFVVLAVFDGWGIAKPSDGNTIEKANTPNYKRLLASFPHTQLGASGDAVGLPRGEVGNTETGHLNLGAGKIVYQDLARINMAIADGSFFENETLKKAIEHSITNKSDLHVMGLVGAGGVHSNIEHLFAVISLAKKYGVENLFIHVFTDGRDSSPTSSVQYVEKIEELLTKEGVGQIASVMGRYWAMDRDKRWERTAKAYLALTKGDAIHSKSCSEAIRQSYAQSITDEFIEPTVILNENGQPKGLIKDNDAIIFFNFRIDRPRQLTRAFVLKDLSSSAERGDFDPYNVKYEKKHVHENGTKSGFFDRGELLKNLYFATMTEYEKTLTLAGVKPAFPPEFVEVPLGRAISMAGLKQLRAAESEKERFVTYYFNGLREVRFDGEDRLIVPSPKVPTYDQAPEMSARQLADQLISKIDEGGYSFILVNFANADMVGHTGNLTAAIKAVEVLDECLGKLASAVLARDGALLVTADHGNAEEMINSTGEINTEHSGNPVPFIIISNKYRAKPQTLPSGILADVAPTILHLLQIDPPTGMIGRNLIVDIV